MNARFLRVAKLNGHHNRAQAGGWGLWQAARAGEREAWEAITQKNYSHSAWKASLRCLRRLMVVVPKKRTMCDWCGGGGRWGELGGEAGAGGGGGEGGGAEVMEVQGNQSNHSLTPAPPQNPNFKWIEMKGHLLIIRSHQNVKSWRKQSKVDKIDFWRRNSAIWEPTLAAGWERAEASKTFLPRG